MMDASLPAAVAAAAAAATDAQSWMTTTMRAETGNRTANIVYS